jgi:hypothetical protein
MIAPLVLSLLVSEPGQVTLRAGLALPAPEVISTRAEGVVVGLGGQPEFVIGWDRVLRLEGPAAAESEAFLSVGEALWRARTRLERGDAAAAEPIFERLLPALDGKGGPMPAMAAEGLLRCRLRRGAQIAAVDPWLAWLRSRDAGAMDGAVPFAADWSARAGLEPIMDPATGLIPALPPIWLDWPAVRVFASSGGPAAGASAGGDAPAMGALYLHAARFETGAGEAVPAVSPGGSPGVALVQDIVQARAGGEGQRAAARERLAQRLAGARDTWLEAWCRAAIGRSLIRESDVEVRRLGVVELLHLPARFSRAHPYLAGLCLAEASVTLGELGDDDGAARLRKELLENYPDHPVLAWDRIRIGAPALPGGSGPSRSPGVIPLNITECLNP